MAWADCAPSFDGSLSVFDSVGVTVTFVDDRGVSGTVSAMTMAELCPRYIRGCALIAPQTRTARQSVWRAAV